MALRIKKITIYDTETNESREAGIELIRDALNGSKKLEGITTVSELFNCFYNIKNEAYDLKKVINQLKKQYTNDEIRRLVNQELESKVIKEQDKTKYAKTAFEAFSESQNVIIATPKQDEKMADEVKNILKTLIYDMKAKGYSTATIGEYVKEFMHIHNDYSCELDFSKFNKDLQTGDLLIPEGVKRIFLKDTLQTRPNIKFAGQLYLPETLEVIDEGVFELCDSIKGELKLPKNLKQIKENAFRNCLNITKLEINDKLEYIGDSAFEACTSIGGTLNFGSKLNKVGKSAFEGCKSIKELKFADGTQEISKNAFKNCKGLEKVEFPNTLKKLGSGAFSDCQNLEGNFELPEGLKIIEDYTFNNCNKLDKVSIKGAEVGDVNRFAFNGCQRLESVFIGKINEKNYINRFR